MLVHLFFRGKFFFHNFWFSFPRESFPRRIPGSEGQKHLLQTQDPNTLFNSHINLPLRMWNIDPHSWPGTTDPNLQNEMLQEDLWHLIQRQNHKWRRQEPSQGSYWITQWPPLHSQNQETEIVRTCYTSNRTCKNHHAGHSTRREEARQTKEMLAWQIQGMDGAASRQDPETSRGLAGGRSSKHLWCPYSPPTPKGCWLLILGSTVSCYTRGTQEGCRENGCVHREYLILKRSCNTHMDFRCVTRLFHILLSWAEIQHFTEDDQQHIQIITDNHIQQSHTHIQIYKAATTTTNPR